MRPPSRHTVPSIPYCLFAEKRLRATRSATGALIASTCGYFSAWNDDVHRIYDALDGLRDHQEIAASLGLPALDVRRTCSLFALVGLVDLFDGRAGLPIRFDTALVQRALDLLYHEKDTFLTQFYLSLFGHRNYSMQESCALFAFFAFLAHGGTTERPFFQVLQAKGELWNVLALSEGQCAAIGLALFVAAQRALGAWWSETHARSLRDAFLLVSDVLASTAFCCKHAHLLVAS